MAPGGVLSRCARGEAIAFDLEPVPSTVMAGLDPAIHAF
jgi:hypothetical protein